MGDQRVQHDLRNFAKVQTWTDEEWREVIERFEPETHIEVAIKYIEENRSRKEAL